MFMSLLHGQYVDMLRNLVRMLLTRTTKLSTDFLKNTNVLLLQKSDDSPQNKEYIQLLTELNAIPESSAYLMLIVQIITILNKKYISKACDALTEVFQSSYSNIDPETKAHYQSLKYALEKEEIPALTSTLQKELWVTFFLSLDC